ncbi:hypothetical protein ELI56_15625 [Rhizobium ruizarguesonis]|uniref:hypothetical protein n=1 Tax=Rhizobium ruizarguesonis TaxID=2081791 RepID=UPI000375273F|nr:hypothetical protein [Rhizobium ruizarguesonis]TAT79530.1 hypothetical protein ELI56_15625 [Rhizobium ruizarguesonis]WSH63698.1 hypothetical protein U8Q05_18915 [Rhizobium ruizarguesonis]
MTKRGDDHLISRRELYDLAWSMSADKAGLTLKITGEHFSNICRALDIPRPGRGYWKMEKAGTAGLPPALPPPSRGVPDGWKPGDPTEHGRAPRKLRQPIGPLTFADFQESRRLHELVKPAAKELRRAEPGVDGHYLRPRIKRGVVDLTCSEAGLEKCLRFTSDLFKRLESPENGHRVSIAPVIKGLIRAPIDTAADVADRGKGISPSWFPLRPTVVSVLGVSIGLAVVETSRSARMRFIGGGNYVPDTGNAEDYVPPTWVVVQNLPTGMLRLTAYSPFHGVPWQRQWTETPGTLFSSSLESIVRGIEAGAHELFLALDKAGIQPG